MNNENFIFGVVLTDAFEVKDYTKHLKDYDLKFEDIEKLKPAYLFRLSDNIRFRIFDADMIFLDEENESYYSTGEFTPIEKVANENIIALINDNNDIEMI